MEREKDHSVQCRERKSVKWRYCKKREQQYRDLDPCVVVEPDKVMFGEIN